MKDLYYEILFALLIILFVIATAVDVTSIMNNSINSLNCDRSNYCYVK